LVRDFQYALSTLDCLSNNIAGIDAEVVEPLEQLKSVGSLFDELGRCSENVEKLQRMLHAPERLVQHVIATPADLHCRIQQLQTALVCKENRLNERVKLRSLLPEIHLITESVQSRAKQIEQALMNTVDEQNAALCELEAKKRQLENLAKNIPCGAEGDELREMSNSQLGLLNDLLVRLTAAVGGKLAAISAFNAMKDEVVAQLSSLEIVPAVNEGDETAYELECRIQDLNLR
uniref:SKA2 domain-containing protein n=1 Tax=Gongylonema pulchrum TaxID=637853 RepID=A0A183EPC9_9BILA